jgi:TfoX/Sxy family transcriptional regulator of competence genes
VASDESFVTFVCDQLAQVPQITCRKMFGEYAVYCGGKVVALVCDNQLFVKPTPAGRQLLGDPVEGFPYKGAKPHFLIAERLDDREWLSRLVEAAARDVPEPKPKAAKAGRK